MWTKTYIACAALALGLVATPALAQTPQAPTSEPRQHIVDGAAIQSAVTARVADDEANRKVIRQAFETSAVRDGAARLGLSLADADRAVALMSSEELRQLAEPASAIVDHAGGDRTIVISTTTLLLGIIILLLLAN